MEDLLAKMTGKRIENEVLGKLSFPVISSYAIISHTLLKQRSIYTLTSLKEIV